MLAFLSLFSLQGVAVMTMQELFEFVMSDQISDVDAYLSQMQVKISQRSSEMDAKAQIEEGVFMGAPVIRRLDELIDHEKEHQKLKSKAVGFHGAIAQMTVQEDVTSSKTSKPSAKPVHAPSQAATDRNGAAPSLFAGLLLPQVEDQQHLTNGGAAQPGYVSGEELEDDEEEEEEEDTQSVASRSTITSSKQHVAHSAKPSAKPVHAPEKSATDRGGGASTLFAGLLLPQLEDQLTLTNSVPEPGYISGEEEDEAEEHEDGELRANANHTEAGGRRVMTHVQRKVKRGDAQESSEEESDGEGHSDASGSSASPSGSGSDDEDASAEAHWVDRPKMSEDELRAARKAAKKDAKAAQAEKRKTKIKKKDKKAKINKGKH